MMTGSAIPFPSVLSQIDDGNGKIKIVLGRPSVAPSRAVGAFSLRLHFSFEAQKFGNDFQDQSRRSVL